MYQSKGQFTFDKTFSAMHICVIVSNMAKNTGIFENYPWYDNNLSIEVTETKIACHDI
jgi:hypothetical protein